MLWLVVAKPILFWNMQSSIKRLFPLTVDWNWNAEPSLPTMLWSNIESLMWMFDLYIRPMAPLPCAKLSLNSVSVIVRLASVIYITPPLLDSIWPKPEAFSLTVLFSMDVEPPVIYKAPPLSYAPLCLMTEFFIVLFPLPLITAPRTTVLLLAAYWPNRAFWTVELSSVRLPEFTNSEALAMISSTLFIVGTLMYPELSVGFVYTLFS